VKAVIVSDETVSGSVGGAAEREAHVHLPTGRRLLVGDDVAENAERYGLTVVDVDEADLAPIAAAEVPEPDKTSEATVEPELAAVDAETPSTETVQSESVISNAASLVAESAADNLTVPEETTKQEAIDHETHAEEAVETSEEAAA
jgi:hypothetical protein